MRTPTGLSNIPVPSNTLSSRPPLPLAMSVAPVSAAPEVGMPRPSVRGIEPLPPGSAMKLVSAVLSVSAVFATCCTRALRSASKPFGKSVLTRTAMMPSTSASSRSVKPGTDLMERGFFMWIYGFGFLLTENSEDAQHLFERGEPGRGDGDAVLPERAVAQLGAERVDFGHRRIRRDQRQKFLDRDDLVRRDPAAVAAPAAPRTAD